MSQKSHKTDVRIYIEDDHKAYLKQIADNRGISVNQLVMELINKKYPYNKKVRALMQTKEQTAEAVAPAEESAPDREQQEARLQEVNAILRRAFNGEKLPKDEFQKLKDEQTELRAILGHK